MQTTDKWNVVMVVMDSARADRFGCYGYRRGVTPVVDDIAGQGTLFKHMITAAPWTLPSHASLFTGLYPREHGADRPSFKMRNGPVTLMGYLRAHGYSTAVISNNQLVSPRTGIIEGTEHYLSRRRFDRDFSRRWARKLKTMLALTDSGGRAANRVAAELFRSVSGPLFVFINYMEVHWKYAPPRPYERRFVRRRFSWVDSVRYRLHTRFRHSWEPWEADEEEGALLSDLYDGSLSCVDDRIGDLVEELKRSGRDGETIVLLTSDHGEQLGERGRAGHGYDLYQPLLHVPFVARIPGRGSATIDGLVQLTDIFAGLCRLLEIPAPDHLADRKFSVDPFQLQPGDPGRTAAFAELRSFDGEGLQARLRKRLQRVPKWRPPSDMESVQDSRYKLISTPGSGSDALFDLATDPEEARDIRDEAPGVAAALRTALSEWRDSCRPVGDQAAYSRDEERALESRLRDLGYI